LSALRCYAHIRLERLRKPQNILRIVANQTKITTLCFRNTGLEVYYFSVTRYQFVEINSLKLYHTILTIQSPVVTICTTWFNNR
jgi:hypothetical protein